METSEHLTFPQARSCPYQAPPGYAALGDADRLTRIRLYDGRVAWFVTGYREARRLLADPRLSADRSRPDYPLVAPRFAAAVARRLPLLAMDPPEHTRYRKLLNQYFSLRQVHAMTGDVQRVVDTVVDRMLAGGRSAEIVGDFAVPIPSLVISAVLGLPDDDLGFFQDTTRRLMQADEEASSQQAGAALVDYFAQVAEAQYRQPTAGLLGTLATQGALDAEELTQVALLLLVAGHATTTSMLGLSVVTLLDHPEALAALRADPETMPAAVEELLRIIAVTDLAAVRVAQQDIDLDGVLISTGDGVLISATLANRDDRLHAQSDTFDIHRPPAGHLTFGHGIHQCLGQTLARLELRIALQTLIRRIPTLRLAVGADELFLHARGGTVQEIAEIPVVW